MGIFFWQKTREIFFLYCVVAILEDTGQAAELRYIQPSTEIPIELRFLLHMPCFASPQPDS